MYASLRPTRQKSCRLGRFNRASGIGCFVRSDSLRSQHALVDDVPRVLMLIPPSSSSSGCPPIRIGAYTVIEEVGCGAMSRVYLARRDGARTLCVLKVLRNSLRGSEVARRRFMREARLASYLLHPGIARILSAWGEADGFCISYEFIPGQTLRAILDRLRDR